ncbi:AAA family ATPase [Streptomyces europaeiscabiei]|uniref:AAA family ATPase n=1 Tax=Streptomyces europaeiscabiei TaxID=146819 RepID=UPI002E29B5C8|nr:AAA family ATPase [Streptomyces europaeiscabiei]
MYVTRVQLTDIKGFSGRRAVDLRLRGEGGWTVIAGRNSSGKTTLLQAIALALCGPDASASLNVNIDGWATDGAEAGYAKVDLHVDAEADAFISDLRAPSTLQMSMKWPRLTRQRGEGVARWPSVEVDDESLMRGRQGPWGHAPRGWFCAGYGPFRRLASASGFPSHRTQTNPPGPVDTLFRDDAALSDSVGWVLDLHYRALEQEHAQQEESTADEGAARRLLDAVLGLLGDGLLPDRFQIRGVSSDGLWVRMPGRKASFPLRELSDGYRSVAALVLDIVRQIHAAYGHLQTEDKEDGGAVILQPGVVLIDEVDAHLHVTWQRWIGDWLREHFPNIQFIVTSHSPYICQTADEGALIRLPGPEEDSPPAVVDEDLYRRVVYGSADDAVLSELFGLETPYSSRAERLRRRLVALERKVYAETATAAETEEYGELSRLLTSSVRSRVAEVAARLDHEQ